MNKIISLVLFLTFFLFYNTPAKAIQNTNANPWGYTGLINMPTANVLNFGQFYLTGNYLFRNIAFVGNAHMGIFDGLELGIVGGIPSTGFTGMAGNLKYQLIKPTLKNPTALAFGVNLLGLSDNTLVIKESPDIPIDKAITLTTTNNIYMVLSHDFNWKIGENEYYNMFSGHAGFSGNLGGARIMLGLDVPITKYVNVQAEYLGKMDTFNNVINLGFKIKPIDFLTLCFYSIGYHTGNFAQREYMLSVSYNGELSQLYNDSKNGNNTNKPEVITTPVPTQQPEVLVTPNPQETVLQITPEQTPIPVATQTTKPKEFVSEVKTPLIDSTPIPTPIQTPKATPTPKVEITVGEIKGKVTDSIRKNLLENVSIELQNTTDSKIKFFATTTANGLFEINNIPKGEYSIKLLKKGYQESKKFLVVKSNEVLNITTELELLRSSLSGKVLDSNGNPVDKAVLLIDEKTKSSTDKSGKYIFDNLAIGSHTLSIYANNKKVKSLDIDIIAGQDLKKEIILELEQNKTNKPKIDTPQTQKDNESKTSLIKGKITSAKNSLEGVRIMLEGKKLTIMTVSRKDGTYEIKNIPAGTYNLTMSKKGFGTKAYSVEIKGTGESKQHNVSLDKE